ncbi:ribonuclease R [Acuticoccus sp. M5D2P5]|uniref:ribonuclease R n=1 Tax=Acuticoccus kalidii TaxID=2910977 RepID=UPI001F2215D3|nr:ribonuclease R [Acuticoccus kalidii]MCF3935522.1 ribonuclease R [Acuticoccus kalidii]
MAKTDGPTRDEILRFVAESPGRVGKREIARAFGVKGGERIQLKNLLTEMAEEGLLAKTGKHIGMPGKLPRVTLLVVTGRNDDGDLVAEPTQWDDDDGAKPKVTLVGKGPAPAIGDRLLARISQDADERPLGRVIKVIERRPATTLAVLERFGDKPQLTPITKKERDVYFLDPADVKDVASNTLVKIEVDRRRSARIVEVVGPVGSEQAVSLIAIHAHGIPDRFPERVLVEAEAATPARLESGREDWRDVPFVTIDPADAKDHDDAVFAEPDPHNEGGAIVTVAIADVAHYVTTGSAMDEEARLRGNSTYFPDRVVPMLPERISNDLCSLREGEARAAMAIRMVFAADGRKQRHSVHRILMRSARRLSYQEAQTIADGKASDISGQIQDLWNAYAILKRGRQSREPMELDLPERKILLTPEGEVLRVVVPERLDAHKLIEEFMIQANVAASETCEAKRIPLLYRIHDAPGLDKIDALREFLATLEIRLARGTRMRPSHFNDILSRVEGTPNAQLVNEVILRSQSQAEYSPDNLGHFGLNLRRYAHFTSPIRRYADLIVHRALIRAEGLGEDGLTDDEIASLTVIGEEISATERRSMLAERDTIDRLIAGWLADKVGATFEGRIAGVTKSGLFVKLAESGGDGFIPISMLANEYMIYDEDAHELVGETSGVTYRLGDRVTVRLMEAAPISGALRFEIEDHEATAAPKKRARRPMRPVRRNSRPSFKRGKR